MVSRTALKKSTRFEIFKRDSFTCQYCGKQPPDVVLEIDHINPIKEGGDNDDMNLITACVECNRGKGVKRLDEIPNRPDADLKWLEMQQEIAELKRYQTAKVERDKLQAEIIESLQDKWWMVLGKDSPAPSECLFIRLFAWAYPEQIEKAIEIMGGKSTMLSKNFDDRFRYLCGVLHRLVDQDNGYNHA